jgi:hypothetical protein
MKKQLEMSNRSVDEDGAIVATPEEATQEERSSPDPQKGNRIERKSEGANGRPHREALKAPAEGFFSRLGQMTEAEWEQHKLYIYRRWPRVSRDDAPHYIGAHRQAIDEEFIKGMYGSGRYLLKLNNQKRTIDNASLEIQDLAFPPKLSPDELMDCPENERYHKLWPAESQKATATTANGSSDSAVKELAGVLKLILEKKDAAKEGDESKRALNSLIDWALRQKEAERAESSPTALAILVKEIKGILPTPTPPTAPAPQSDMATLLKLAKELQPAPAPNPLQLLEQAKTLFSPPQDDLAHIDRLFSIADKLAGLRGSGGGSRSGWDVGLDYVRELVPWAPYLGGIFGLRMPGVSAPGGVPGTASAAAPPAAFDPYANPDLLKRHAQNMNASASGKTAGQPSPAPGQSPPLTPDATQSQDEISALLTSYGPIVLSALNSGVSGAEFADNIARLFGSATPAVIGNHGEDILTQNMMSIPEFKLFGEARLRRFAHEFICYEEILESENEPAEDSGAVA